MHRYKLAGVFTTVLLMASSNLYGEEPKVSDERLNEAIAAMRNIDPKSVKPEERESKAQALQKTWETVLAAGARRFSSELMLAHGPERELVDIEIARRPT